MPKWEIAIAVCNEPESYRKQEGDIIAFKPSPWSWGKKELDQYLIVIIDGMTQDEMVQLCFPLYKDGEMDEEIIMANHMKPIGKRRYCLPFDIIKDGWEPALNNEKVRDKTLVYQPLKDNSIVINAAEKVSIFLDKYTLTYKYNQKKKLV
jgi:hypothetical protein